jgi:hypothetical protein
LSGGNTVVEVDPDETVTAPVKTGYTTTWTETQNGEDYFDFNTPVTEPITLYEKESTPISYSITYHKNDGSGTTNQVSGIKYDEAGRYHPTLTSLGWTREDYSFGGGWATSSGGAKVYNDGAAFSNLTSTEGANVDLFAVWVPAAYESDLRDLYWQVRNYLAADYKCAVWDDFATYRTMAKNALHATGLETAKEQIPLEGVNQSEAKTIYRLFKQYSDELVKTEPLETVVNAVKSTPSEPYTAASWGAFASKLSQAQGMLANVAANRGVETTENVASMASALTAAYNALELDIENLRALYNRVKNWREDQFTASSWSSSGFADAREAAREVLYENAPFENEIYWDLWDAVNALIVDTSECFDVEEPWGFVDPFGTIDPDDVYKNWDEYENALEELEWLVNHNPPLTLEDYEAAKDKVLDARDNLIFYDIDGLQRLVDEYLADKDKYTDESWAEFKPFIDSAVEWIAEQREWMAENPGEPVHGVRDQIETLEDAAAGLVLKPELPPTDPTFWEKLLEFFKKNWVWVLLLVVLVILLIVGLVIAYRIKREIALARYEKEKAELKGKAVGNLNMASGELKVATVEVRDYRKAPSKENFDKGLAEIGTTSGAIADVVKSISDLKAFKKSHKRLERLSKKRAEQNRRLEAKISAAGGKTI